MPHVCLSVLQILATAILSYVPSKCSHKTRQVCSWAQNEGRVWRWMCFFVPWVPSSGVIWSDDYWALISWKVNMLTCILAGVVPLQDLIIHSLVITIITAYLQEGEMYPSLPSACSVSAGQLSCEYWNGPNCQLLLRQCVWSHLFVFNDTVSWRVSISVEHNGSTWNDPLSIFSSLLLLPTVQLLSSSSGKWSTLQTAPSAWTSGTLVARSSSTRTHCCTSAPSERAFISPTTTSTPRSRLSSKWAASHFYWNFTIIQTNASEGSDRWSGF